MTDGRTPAPLRSPAIPASPVRVLVVDDDDLVREAYRAFLQPRTCADVAGEARNGSEAIEAYETLRPDLVMMDLQMPVMGGIDATRELCRRWPEARVCILTTFGSHDVIVAALRAGASGYLVKDASGPQVLAAIHQAVAGDMPLSPQVRRELVASLTDEAERPRASLAVTPRETAVLQWLAQGLSNAEIAQHLYLSEGSVKQHMSHIAAKLGARSRTQILIRAIQLGLVDPHAIPLE